jgi:membrane protease YdiL (CAAX protease family)
MSYDKSNMSNTQTASRAQAWRNVSVVILLSCLVIGLPNFVVLPRLLPDGVDLRSGAAWFLAIYAACVVLLAGLILVWLRRSGSSLAELGWGKPTTILAIAIGVLFGAAWLGLSLFGAAFVLKGKVDLNLTEINLFRLAMAMLGVIISAGEEIIMRGFVMSELNRAAVPAWLQIIVSGLGFALYHSLGNFVLASFIPSFIVGAMWALIYVLGKRSLTPSIISHGIVNFFGEPYLAMMILSVH